MPDMHIGIAHSRIDGPAKVRGEANYAGDFPAAGLTYGYVVSSRIARGRITAIHDEAALAMPGVLAVISHENREATAWRSKNYQDEVAPPGTPFRPFYDGEVHYSGQPVALVVAEDFETARDAATLVRVDYETDPHRTDLIAFQDQAAEPGTARSGIAPPPKARGDADAAIEAAPLVIKQDYTIAVEHHNPMEPHATTVVWQEDGSLLVHDKVQGVQNSQKYIQAVFGRNDVRVLTPYVGGGFGSGLRPQYQLFLAMLAATELKRSVRVVLTRDQMFTFTHRPWTVQHLTLAAKRDGTITGLVHEAVQSTSRFEEYQEVVVNWSGLLYDIPNASFAYRILPLDTYTPGDMRAPGAPTGTFAIESAIDELAVATGIDPVDLRLKNYADTDLNDGKPFSSKELRSAIQMGQERFGWRKRTAEPRSMRDGRELIGWGMAIGAWEAQMMPHKASARLTADGRLTVACATADLGTGTYTILAQIGAETMGVPFDRVNVLIGDSSLPEAAVSGGSWTAASAGTAVQNACLEVQKSLFGMVAKLPEFASATMDDVVFEDGHVVLARTPSVRVPYADAMRRGGVEVLEAMGSGAPDKTVQKTSSSYSHSACFVEVRVDETLGVVRVTRVVNAVAAGRILNPKTARSQIIGGTVWGLGMALYEETVADQALGRFMNHNLAEYHIAAHADVPEIEVLFVDEKDRLNAMGVKGLGEIGIVATPAAVSNAIWHATGKRIRDLPITIDKILGA